VLTPGARADLVVIDPERLDESLSQYHEEPMASFGGFTRLVRRNPETVPWVLINGKVAVERGQLQDGAGQGRFLPAGELARAQCGTKGSIATNTSMTISTTTAISSVSARSVSTSPLSSS
jgi:N-acyl-D-aspartate/D-glutamate deacylase